MFVKMPNFTADYSSSLPSTPDAGTPQRGKALFGNLSNQFSTTPAGPPPSSAASFTPAGPPPSSTIGSSRLGTGVSKLRFASSSGEKHSHKNPLLPPRTKNGTPAKAFGSTRLFPSQKGSGSVQAFGSSALDEVMSEDDEALQMDMEDDDVENSIGHLNQGRPQAFTGFTAVNAGPAAVAPRSSLFQRSMQGGRSQNLRRSQKANQAPRISILPRKGKENIIPAIARDLAATTAVATLIEPYDTILITDHIVTALEDEVRTSSGNDEVQDVLSNHVSQLRKLWQESFRTSGSKSDDTGIGPGNDTSPLECAEYLSSLLLAIHHPPTEQHLARSSTDFNKSYNTALMQSSLLPPVSVPQVLLNWLDKHHVTYGKLLSTVKAATPNSTSSELFWEAVQSLILRGKLKDVVQLFADADFQYAATAVDDGAEEPGYSGAQLQAIQSVIYRARQVLDGCPGIKNGDWNVNGSEWDLYRRRVASELDHVARLAEGEDEENENQFEAENFGIHKSDRSLLKSMNAPNNVPWTIYQNLRIMYSILMGGAVEIIAQSMDWLEACAALTIWWDGNEDDTIATWSLNVSRSQRPSDTSIQEDPYLARLCAAFLCVTDPDDQDSFMINPQSLLEVGLGSVLQGNIEGVLGVLRSYSLCIASAVAEVGTLAGWLTTGSSSNADGLNEQDLMVLSYGVQPEGIKKDDILVKYAEALFDHQPLRATNGNVHEGWGMAISLASRLDDQELAYSTTSGFIEQLPLVSQERMDKLVKLCIDLGLEEEARKVSEKYGDHLVNTSTQYGTALICYARSHSPSKIRIVVDLLVSYSLVSSTAYPQASDMDNHLKILVDNPRQALSNLSQQDPEAAEMLSFYLFGYACLRKFYQSRDEDILAKAAGLKATVRPLARKRAAAKALIAVINSAADSIYGGLYDSERQSAIQVDGLLTLLGEATAFLAAADGDKRTLTTEQMYALLAAIEDLQTVNSRVYDATEECLQASLRNYHGSAPPSPRDMLKKSVSSGTNSNFSFSMMGSEMMLRSEESGRSAGGKSVGGSGVLVGNGKAEQIERGWDWRAAFKHKDVKGQDVLRRLRFGIAKELSIAELEEGEPMYS